MAISRQVYRRWLGNTLAALRGEVPQNAAAEALGCTPGRIRHFESGRNLPRASDIEVLLRLYGADDRIDELTDLARQIQEAPPEQDLSRLARTPSGLATFLGLEQGATAITEFGVMTVPGLLQTREYATAVLASGETGGITAREVQRRVEQRLRRQAALHRDHDAVRVTAILDESVLRRQVGGPDVLRAQLGHLSEISTLPNVSIRVLPYTTVVPIALSGPFIQMQFGLPGDDGLVYVEDRLGGRVIDDPDSIDEYTLVTSALLDESLSVADSRTMINQIGDHL